MTQVFSQTVYDRVGGTAVGPSYSKGINLDYITSVEVSLSHPEAKINAEIVYKDGVTRKIYTTDTAATVIAKT